MSNIISQICDNSSIKNLFFFQYFFHNLIIRINKIKFLEGFIRGYIGSILSNLDNNHLSEAEDWIKSAIEANEKNDMALSLGLNYDLYAELFKRKGDLSKAKENKSKAIEIFKNCGADGWCQKAEERMVLFS